MVDEIYRTFRCEDGGFSVEVTRPGNLPLMAGGFASEADADAWIAQDKRLWDAADPFRTPASRRRRGY
ncbi:MAG TPA: hypothetical protein VL614_17585 [Acetobacteraceae bacterium]|jgi:hypothetical protein|nr:hypothetical protein [Acetobacteraceae bacterium]